MSQIFNERLKELSPFAAAMGIKISRFENGECESSIEIKDFMLNIHKGVHGGVIYSLADISMGAALYSLLSKEELCSTIEIKINYLKPAFTSELFCFSKVVQKGKNIAVLEAEIRYQEHLIAKAMGTFVIKRAGIKE